MAATEQYIQIPYRAIVPGKAAPDATQPSAIVATVTVLEQHHDTLTITDHPVSQNAPITDHAFKQPQRLTLHIGWSASDTTADAQPQDINKIYETLLTVQESRIPFVVYTGKRVYKNMLIEAMSTETDEKTQNVLFITLACKQVILVSTQSAFLGSPASVQASPQNTAGVLRAGQNNPKPVAQQPPFFSLDAQNP